MRKPIYAAMLGMLGQTTTVHADACQSLLCLSGELQKQVGKIDG